MLSGQKEELNIFNAHLNDENASLLLYFSVSSWLVYMSFIMDMWEDTDMTPILYESFFSMRISYYNFGSFND